MKLKGKKKKSLKNDRIFYKTFQFYSILLKYLIHHLKNIHLQKKMEYYIISVFRNLKNIAHHHLFT